MLPNDLFFSLDTPKSPDYPGLPFRIIDQFLNIPANMIKCTGNVPIVKSLHPESQAVQVFRSGSVFQFFRFKVVLFAVQFDDQLRLYRKKINDIWPNRGLSAEVSGMTAKKIVPEPVFFPRGIPAKGFDKRFVFLFVITHFIPLSEILCQTLGIV